MAGAPELTASVDDALRAPSVHNTQPWRWRIRRDGVELHADRSRLLVATDPDGRDLVLSCGAALHHLRVALAARGLRAEVAYLPDPEADGHLATVTLRPGSGDVTGMDLFPAIARRRTERRRMSHRPVPDGHLDTLVEVARAAGAVLVPVPPPARERLAALLDDAARRQRDVPGYTAELHGWTHRHAGSHDGVPAGNVAPVPVGGPLRPFPQARLAQPPLRPGLGREPDAARMLVLATIGDTALDRLVAGEAASAVLLAATALGLATTPLSQALEIESTRHELRWHVLGVPEHPQLLLRVGWPARGVADLPATPRRPLRSVLVAD